MEIVGLTPQAERLIEGIRDAQRKDGQFVSRQEIARAIGKKRLNAAETAILDLLSAQGILQAQRRKTNAPSGYFYVYRTALPEVS